MIDHRVDDPWTGGAPAVGIPPAPGQPDHRWPGPPAGYEQDHGHDDGPGYDDALGQEPEPEGAGRPKVPELPYLPGLDGLRALALLGVLAFSGGITQVKGGFLAISTAFTLSGFLLTTMLLAEWAQRSRLDLGELWARRASRIAPPYYAVIALVVVLQMTLRVGSVPTFRTDVWAGVTFATNWQLVFPSEGFASSFNELSALRHLWPVAIVVQLTLLLPVAFAALMAVAGRNWRIAGGVFALLTAGSFGLAWVMGGNPDALDIVYHGTHTRAGEFLVGVVLAYLVLTPSFRSVMGRPRVLRVIRAGGVAAGAGLLVLWVLMPIDSPALFRGGTLVNALLTGWVVLAVTMPGITTSVLGSWPARKLGEVSFCAYLLHWPLFLLVDEDRTGLDGILLFGARVAVTLLVAVALAWAVEATFRWRLELPRAQLGAGLAATAAILAVLAAILPVNPPANISLTVDDGDGPGDLDVVTPVDGATEAARVLVIGDETAASVVPGFEVWNQENPDTQLRIDTHVASDCPMGGPGEMRRFGETEEPTLECEAWRYRLPEMLDAADYDVVVVLMGTSDLGEREVNREWHHLGDPVYDRWMADQIGALGDVVAEPGVPVVWLTSPHVRLTPSDGDDGGSGQDVDWTDFDDNDPTRVNRLNALIAAGVRNRDDFHLLDLDAWLHGRPGGEFSRDVRAGAEFTEAGAGGVTGWLGPELLESAGVSAAEGDGSDGSGDGDGNSGG